MLELIKNEVNPKQLPEKPDKKDNTNIAKTITSNKSSKSSNHSTIPSPIISQLSI